MVKRLTAALAMVSAAVVPVLLATQQPGPSTAPTAPIRLRAVTFDPSRGESSALGAPQAGRDVGTRGHFLVQFRGPVLETWKQTVRSAGADLVEYVPDFAFRIRATPNVAIGLRQLPFVAWVGPYDAAFRLAPEAPGDDERLYLVRLERDAEAGAVAAGLAAAGVAARLRGASSLMVRLRSSQRSIVTGIDGVASLEPWALRVKHNEYGGGLILGSQAANLAGFDGSTQVLAVADTGIGDGTATGAHAHIDASRVRSVFNRPGVPDFCFETLASDGAVDVDSGHGTHVASAALGAGNGSGVGRGTAPAAGLVFQAIEDYAVPSVLCSLIYGIPEGYYLVGLPADLADLFQQAYDVGARVHSDSWGAAVGGAYTADSENTDAFTWAHRDMVVVFSAGNSGVDANGDGLVDPGSIGAPGTAKNVITVGASENDRLSAWECDPTLTYTACAAQGGQNRLFRYGEAWPQSYPAPPLRDDPSAGNAEQLAAFSSRGPTTDGRIKPDVVAPGTWTLSGYSDLFQQQYDAAPNPTTGAYQYDGWGFPADAAYKYMGGTSMSAPLVAGGAALVRDFFQKARGHHASAALVKATLVNSAVDLLDENNDGVLDNAFPIPNHHEGWGRVDLRAATDGTAQFSDETAPLTTGATATYTFNVLEEGHPFRATLAWTDYPGQPAAAVHLVNDLDLIVVAPGGQIYRGNAFDGGWSTVAGTPDRLNNLENAFVPVAAAGSWTVTVSGYNVPMGPQPFALVVDHGSQPGETVPVVRVSTVDGLATEVGPTSGLFRVVRSGDVTAPLTVRLAIGGTAAQGDDYAALPDTLTIPAGQAAADLEVHPVDDASVEPDETVVLLLAPDDGYTVRSPGSGVVTIESDDVPPDLVVSAVSAPSWAAVGGTVSVNDTTRNQGTLGAPPFETAFYLSTNSSLDAADVYLGARAVPSLAAGSSDSSTTSVSIPEATATGTYYVIARADWWESVQETSESNNARASGLVRIGPDLLVPSLSVPSTAAAGGTLSVTDTTKNQGQGASPATATSFYLSANAAWDLSDLPLATRPVAALASGASHTATTSVRLPEPLDVGTYYIVAVVDVENAVAEVFEQNNSRVSVSVRVGADLTVSAVAAPSASGSLATISVTDTTRNAGSGDSPASSTHFVLSTNTSFDAGDVPLGVRAVPSLAGGATDSATVSLVIPATTAVGTYYVLARADGANEVNETSETNNVKASGVLKIGPDLAILSLSVPSTGGAGRTLSVTDSIRNQGGSAAQPTEAVFYLSANTSLDAGDVELGRRGVPELPPSATDAAGVDLVVPASVSTGTYYVIAVVDPAGVVAEATESNNVKVSGSVRVGPDLAVSSVTGPLYASRGSVITITDTVRNQGGGAAVATRTGYYFSTNGALDAADTWLAGREVGPLDAGASSTASTAVTIPSNLATGTYYVIARTDDGAGVIETIENNNTRSLSVRVNP